MSLLIDVLTKADQANSEEADGDSTATPQDSNTEDAGHDEAVSELSLAPDNETPQHAATADEATGAKSPAADSGAPAQTEAPAPAAVSAAVPAPGRRRPHRANGAGARKLAALVGAPALVAAALLIGLWMQQEPLTPIDYSDDPTLVAESSEPAVDARMPARNPELVGPPIQRSRRSLPPTERVLVAEIAATSAPIAEEAELEMDLEADSPVIDAPDAPLADSRIVIEKNDHENPRHKNMRRAYDAFRQGDYASAMDAYRAALDEDPANQDALLGLAALALRAGDAQQAAHYYEATLDLDPNDSVAIAGLVALQEGGSPIDRESFLKNLLYERPTAAHLHFSLGIQYASQARWSDAQQAFFDAFSHDSSNADYAFNLAVSLDRLGQGRSAADYYRRSLELASGNHVIDTTAAQRRLEALTSDAGGDPQ